MIEGLFLDRVNLQSGGRAVTEAEKFSVLIYTDEAKTGLAVANVAVSRTEITMDAVACFGFPPEGLVEGGGFLKNVEIGHGARPDTSIIRAREREGATVCALRLIGG